MASRNEQRATEAISRIEAEVPGADVRFLHFDLTDFATATRAAETFMQQQQRLDILVNNAGIVSSTSCHFSPAHIHLYSVFFFQDLAERELIEFASECRRPMRPTS